ncbi:MAG: pyridoxamine 5'-phosphate oxidase family protein [Bacteroidetes bacterium]|nr:pyridoxamine 5'-phosphate oxidase family protein [Bacteroidota bacterium]
MNGWIAASVLCWLATADADGLPNVSPKEMFFRHGDDRLLIAHIASPVTVRNIRQNPNVCVSMVDLFVQKGYKFTGTARITEQRDAEFAALQALFAEQFGSRFADLIRAVIAVTVTAAQPVIAPSYRFFPETTTEQGQIDQAMERYGVRPR